MLKNAGVGRPRGEADELVVHGAADSTRQRSIEFRVQPGMVPLILGFAPARRSVAVLMEATGANNDTLAAWRCWGRQSTA